MSGTFGKISIRPSVLAMFVIPVGIFVGLMLKNDSDLKLKHEADLEQEIERRFQARLAQQSKSKE